MYNIKFQDLVKKKVAPTQGWLFSDQHPIIRTVLDPMKGYEFNKEDIYKLKQMVHYIDQCYLNKAKKYNIRAGIAIAANQVGWNKRVVYIHFDDDIQENHYLLINPEIISVSENKAFLSAGEGCLSVHKDREGFVIRHEWIEVKAYDLIREEMIHEKFSGFLGICMQHELDHINAALYYDRINSSNKFYKEPQWVQIGRSK
ncbi:peptide deformylase [Ureaplasma miroungigenitalium]|uniref:peptide deformylase n=1 Tax=Ureaplasma miroungigenitalium TaxID=1042321 RepID=UPI0021E73EEF|nr:peptide deformylase [Ureaplasma miroungigenitalium]MCV3734514.1 peptide deformylase [Ureaplasma miroungigenitalium]